MSQRVPENVFISYFQPGSIRNRWSHPKSHSMCPAERRCGPRILVYDCTQHALKRQVKARSRGTSREDCATASLVRASGLCGTIEGVFNDHWFVRIRLTKYRRSRPWAPTRIQRQRHRSLQQVHVNCSRCDHCSQHFWDSWKRFSATVAGRRCRKELEAAALEKVCELERALGLGSRSFCETRRKWNCSSGKLLATE